MAPRHLEIMIFRKAWSCVPWLLVAGHVAVAQQNHPPTNEARRPQAVAELPGPLRLALARENCRIPAAPQPLGPDARAQIPHVAYQAALLTTSRQDWVVICQRTRAREALVYRVSPTGTPHRVARLPLSDWSPEDEGCEGWIGIADTAVVRAVPRLKRLAPVREGVLDGRCEGATFYYWAGTQWSRIPVP